ncbi:hypothetical protein GWC77_28695, partial [Paraburkholderia sp. NMBU_R16]|nr:hypothetical protein [Paraburkholderia sp. NMBU_R16]
VVVVIGDPPTDRGQLAQPLNLEDISPVEIQLLNRPRKRVTPSGSMTHDFDATRLSLLLNDLRLPAIKQIWPSFAERSDTEGWPA